MQVTHLVTSEQNYIGGELALLRHNATLKILPRYKGTAHTLIAAASVSLILAIFGKADTSHASSWLFEGVLIKYSGCSCAL